MIMQEHRNSVILFRLFTTSFIIKNLNFRNIVINSS